MDTAISANETISSSSGAFGFNHFSHFLISKSASISLIYFTAFHSIFLLLFSVLFPSVRSIPSLTHEVRDFRTLNSKLYIHYCPSYGFLLSCLCNHKTDMVLIHSYHSPSLYGFGSFIHALTNSP